MSNYDIIILLGAPGAGKGTQAETLSEHLGLKHIASGELFRIYTDTNFYSNDNEVTSSYLTDIKITKFNPANSIPFSEIYSTGSDEFNNWYSDQEISASLFDQENENNLLKTLPAYLRDDNKMDNGDFRKFVNMMGEHFDIIKNYIDGYSNILKTQYGDVGSLPENLLPIIAKNYNWDFKLPLGKREDADLLGFMGSSLSNINNN